MKVEREVYDWVDPAALFASIAQRQWAIFLDSGTLDGKRSVRRNANYDVLACEPKCTLVTTGGVTKIEAEGVNENSAEDPFILVKKHLPTLSTRSREQRFVPGALGYFSYDLARRIENLPVIADDDEAMPQMAIGIYSVIIVIDHLKRTTSIVFDAAEKVEVQQWRERISSTRHLTSSPRSTLQGAAASQISDNMGWNQYQQRFSQVRSYTIEGDCYQVNLSKRFKASIDVDPWQLYLRLRTISPAPYAAYLKLPFAEILSNSPESFIQCRQSKVITSPIKGTRPRDLSNSENDRRIAQQLLSSEKDRAENLMIVDLMRNDLSRCCEAASVCVPKLFSLHSFANVHHLISTVEGRLQPDLHSLDLLRQCFPGGSITGAPKIRSMQIIEELEPHRRGVYCGSIGYVGIDGTLETNIAIRTMVIKQGVIRYSAGGGLVLDSNSSEEYREIKHKARMMRQALMP